MLPKACIAVSILPLHLFFALCSVRLAFTVVIAFVFGTVFWSIGTKRCAAALVPGFNPRIEGLRIWYQALKGHHGHYKVRMCTMTLYQLAFVVGRLIEGHCC